jgi:uncharacterized membrane protein affecting hemolysin expression
MLLSVVIACTVLLLSDYWFDTLSGQTTQAARSVRGPKSEELARKLAALIERGDARRLEAFMEAAAQRDDEIVSVGVRQASGEMLAQTARHPVAWRAPVAGVSTTNHVQVPINAGRELWGYVEISYREMPPPGVAEWLSQTEVALLCAALVASLALWLLVRRRS